RISLAIQVATVGGGALPTLVFDEVDAGIGGGVAEIVGHKLRALAEAGHQVLCVTHLAQVAAQAHRHLSVSKATEGAVTRVAIEGLDEGGRVDELARMLGGVEITAQTRAHAREMLERARGDGAPAAARARGGE
ncbi:MAG: DNA repair protein RecN, partial [Gammaproteobacteria bacterium]|nr:DNA repair protein RecN [Gammaproteobacteria bacterium]NIR82971.1 DNA repair protein RecN [Gammaproteobacteria bacterium]